MDEDEARAALDALIAERGESYAGLSRWLGRNPAYLQQYIKRGTPRRLPEAERRDLARFLGVNEALFGGPAVESAGRGPPVRRLSVAASAGPGRLADRESARRPPAHVDEIDVRGDSMVPVLHDGDSIRVDRADAHDRLRDGIYVLRTGDGVVVKRVSLRPGRRALVSSDNDAYAPWPECDAAALDIVGRVIWFGRRLG